MHRVSFVELQVWTLMKAHIQTKGYGLYVFGVIAYRDAFRCERKTLYRFRLNLDDEGLQDAALDPCDEGNEAT